MRWYFFLASLYIAAIGYLDFLTGFVPDLTILYLIPIILTAAYARSAYPYWLAFFSFLSIEISDLSRLQTFFSFSAYIDGIFHFLIFLSAAIITQYFAKNYKRTIRLQKELNNDLEIAKNTQKAMFPLNKPSFPGLDIDVKITFARGLGGDFYDFVSINNKTIAFLLADIAGKSISAALFTALLKESWRNAFPLISPVSIVKLMNESLKSSLPEETFVTLFCGVIDLESGELRYTNAGHEPGILRTRNGQIRLLESERSMILGIQEYAEDEEQRVTMENGDILFLYTDGLTEPPTANFSGEEIVKLLEKHAGSSVHSIVEEIYAARFSIDKQPIDDVTIVCIKKSPHTETGRI